MLPGHSKFQSNGGIDELDGLFSMNQLNTLETSKFTMKLLPNSDRLYKLKPERAALIMDTMASYRQQGLFCDVVLCVKNQRHAAHKIVLASASSYFASMFGQPGHIEAQANQEINLSEMIPCPTVMNMILDFIYNSEVKLNDQSVSEISRTSKVSIVDSFVGLACSHLFHFVATR